MATTDARDAAALAKAANVQLQSDLDQALATAIAAALRASVYTTTGSRVSDQP